MYVFGGQDIVSNVSLHAHSTLMHTNARRVLSQSISTARTILMFVDVHSLDRFSPHRLSIFPARGNGRLESWRS